MISVNTYNKTKTNDYINDINGIDSILIISKGATPNKLNEIYKPLNRDDCLNLFGSSDLFENYSLARRYGAKNIFVINCYEITDYIECIDYISNYNFAYIAVTGINLSDKFWNDESMSEIYFASYITEMFGRFTNSTIFFTDEHAEKYEDIDNFLMDMHNKVMEFKDSNVQLLDELGRNIAICANCLKDIKYANVLMVALLARERLATYPKQLKTEKAIFNFNQNDFYIKDIIYFKNIFNNGISVENLKNFRTIQDANKLIVIDSVIKYIEKTMDFSFAHGKQYSKYINMKLHDYIDKYMREIKGLYINDYKIKDILAYKNNDNSITIDMHLNILPINSIEDIDLLLEA